jgi:predicted PurR-regulated permease PerM
MNEPLKLPFYSKVSQIIVGTLAFFYVMYIAQDIIVPLIFASLMAILLSPLVEHLVRLKVNRIIAILLVLMVVIIVLGGLCYFIGTQAGMFTEMLPMLKSKVILLFQDIFEWLSHTFNIDDGNGERWVAKIKAEGMSGGPAMIGKTMLSLGGILAILILLPVYIFMILYYKSHLREFVSRMLQRDNRSVVSEVIIEIKTLVQKYLIGLLLEAALVAVLNAAALLILGVPYAILIGLIGALLNVIPYIGGLIAIAIPMLIAFAMKSTVTAFWVLVAYLIVQFIDNNLIVPRVVASKVKINGLLSIIVVLIGGALWGVSGMFLAIPVSAILKVIFDRIEPLKPLGFLLGDAKEIESKPFFSFTRMINTKSVQK